eukprot:7752805-Lingulodinium_polyedra.AAC.1
MIIKAIGMRLLQTGGRLPEWFGFEGAVEDWTKGYRQLFPTVRQMRYNIVAVLRPQKREWLFA